MDAILDLLSDVSADDPTMMVSLLVFLAAATLAFGVMAAMHVRGAVKRRAAGVAVDGADRSDDKRSLRYASRKAAHQRAPDRASRRLPGLHGPPGGVRRRRAEHGGRARPGRPRALRLLSVAQRQRLHDHPGNARRPHLERGARAFRRPARPRGGAL